MHEDFMEFEFKSHGGRLPGPPCLFVPVAAEWDCLAPCQPLGPCCLLGTAGLRVSTNGIHSPSMVTKVARGQCSGPCWGPDERPEGGGVGQRWDHGSNSGADGPSLGGGGNSLRLSGPSVYGEARSEEALGLGCWAETGLDPAVILVLGSPHLP